MAGEIDVVVRGRGPHRPGGREVDARLPVGRARALRLLGRARLRAGRAVPGAVAARPVPRRRSRPTTASRIRALLDAVPPYFSSAVITADRAHRQPRVRHPADVARAPAGGHRRHAPAARPAEGRDARGSPACRCSRPRPTRRCRTRCGGWRRSSLGLLAVLAVLLVARRRRRGGWRAGWARAWVPVVPIALATGWSALVLWLLGVPLNPLSATLGALVLAISTEFARAAVGALRGRARGGHAPAEALRRTYRSTGAAVLASGATAIAGFAVLALSDVRMLRDFGLVTVVDLTVSLLGVLAVLPGRARAGRAAGRRAPRARAGGGSRPPGVGMILDTQMIRGCLGGVGLANGHGGEAPRDRWILMRRPGVLVGVLAVAASPTSRSTRCVPRGPARAAWRPVASCRRSRRRSRCRGSRATRTCPRRPCDVRGPDVLNVCELAERGPVVLAFFAEPVDRCDDQIDMLDRLRSRFPDVQFAAVAIRGDRDDAAAPGARARLGAAGRLRPRRRGGQRLRGRGLPGDHARRARRRGRRARCSAVQDERALAAAVEALGERRADGPAGLVAADAGRRAPGAVARLDRRRGHARADAAASCASGCGGWPTGCAAPRRSRCGSARSRTAHRVFFRHVGLDPDVVRTPVEAVALRRMTEGGLRPRGLIDDALTVAVLETGVGVWAFDASLVGALPRDRARRRTARARRRGGRARGAVRRARAPRAACRQRHAPRRARRGAFPTSPTCSSRKRCGRPGTSCAEDAAEQDVRPLLG